LEKTVEILSNSKLDEKDFVDFAPMKMAAQERVR
jgi:hypothetical protein